MQEIARALLAADHDEMALVAVQPDEEHDAGLVEARPSTLPGRPRSTPRS
jgi:hypothetical protein